MNWKASREDERINSSPLTVIKYLCLRLNYIRNCYILPAFDAHKEKNKKNISLKSILQIGAAVNDLL